MGVIEFFAQNLIRGIHIVNFNYGAIWKQKCILQKALDFQFNHSKSTTWIDLYGKISTKIPVKHSEHFSIDQDKIHAYCLKNGRNEIRFIGTQILTMNEKGIPFCETKLKWNE